MSRHFEVRFFIPITGISITDTGRPKETIHNTYQATKNESIAVGVHLPYDTRLNREEIISAAVEKIAEQLTKLLDGQLITKQDAEDLIGHGVIQDG